MKTVADIETAMLPAAFPVAVQLRPALDEAAFIERVTRQRRQGYHLAAALDDDGVVTGLMGYRYMENLAWGVFLYIDDLVVDEARRSSGIGAALLQLAERLAREAGCQAIHLDSGIQRKRAHVFYETQGYSFTSHHYAREL